MLYLHELTFETKAQAETAARHLSNVERVEVSDSTEDVTFFVDVAQAFDMQFWTTYPLDKRVQAVLSRQTGLIPEMPPAFNLDAQREEEIAQDLDHAVQSIQRMDNDVIRLIEEQLATAENNSVTADAQFCQAQTREQREEALAYVRKAATQYTLLENLLCEINGQEARPLWQQ